GAGAAELAAVGEGAEGGLGPGDAAERGGEAYRAAAVGADVGRAHERRRRGARPAARPAGHVLEVPGVPGRAEEVVVGGHALAELVRRALARDDGPRGAEPLGPATVPLRHVVAEHPRA